MSYFGDIKRPPKPKRIYKKRKLGKRANCCPDKKHYCKGLCRQHYNRSIYKYEKVLFKKTNIKNQHNKEYVYSRQPIVDIPDLNKDSYWIDQDCKMPKLLTV